MVISWTTLVKMENIDVGEPCHGDMVTFEKWKILVLTNLVKGLRCYRLCLVEGGEVVLKGSSLRFRFAGIFQVDWDIHRHHHHQHQLVYHQHIPTNIT